MITSMPDTFLWDPESMVDETESREEARRYLVFQLGEALFVVDISRVRRVLRPVSTSPIPNAPAFIRGVSSIEGHVVPVIHLAERFHLGGNTKTEDQRLLLINLPGQQVGMLVDSASEIVDIPPDRFQPTPAMVAGISGEYVQGVADWRDRLFILLDLGRVLSVEEIAALAESEHME